MLSVQRLPGAARSTTTASMIRSSGASSGSGRERLSVDSSHSVTTSTPASSHQRSRSTILSAPRWWPCALSAPTERAHRRLPSRMTPTCRGTGAWVRASPRASRRSYALYARSRRPTLPLVPSRRSCQSVTTGPPPSVAASARTPSTSRRAASRSSTADTPRPSSPHASRRTCTRGVPAAAGPAPDDVDERPQRAAGRHVVGVAGAQGEQLAVARQVRGERRPVRPQRRLQRGHRHRSRAAARRRRRAARRTAPPRARTARRRAAAPASPRTARRRGPARGPGGPSARPRRCRSRPRQHLPRHGRSPAPDGDRAPRAQGEARPARAAAPARRAPARGGAGSARRTA